MRRIGRLDSRTIDRIAAGEVVERPASVVKELVENAFDAGASSIEIAVSGGGIEEIRVRDDGSGMSREDAALSVERHATSKIASEADLAKLESFGFRGEALPSIASVSRFTLTTSDGAGPEGTRVRIAHGGAPEISPCGRGRGTDVVVEDLFGKTPARRRFLKTPEAETREIVRVVTRAALSRPDCGFRLSAGGRELLTAATAMDAAVRIRQVCGEAIGELVPFEAQAGELRLVGWATRGSVTFATRRMQFLFINGRPVEDRGISRAVAEAAKEAIRVRRHPGAFLFLTLPPEMVDVNVSPAKTQVRFSRPAEIYRLVYHGLLSALVSGKEERRLAPVSTVADFSVAEAKQVYAAAPARPRVVPPLPEDGAARPEPPAIASAARPGPRYAPLAQYDESYIVAAAEEALVLIDQHAAHERVLYERLCDRRETGRPISQALLVPAVWDASPSEHATMAEGLPALRELGFDIEALSGRSYSVSAMPAEASGRDPATMLPDLVESLAESPRDLERARDRLAATLACRSAITIHRRMAREEMERLLEDWSHTRDRFTCPHGRPIVLSLSDEDLLKFFKRR